MEGDIKGKMSSEAPEQSPLDRAKAEANELIQKVQDDLDSIRTAPVNELEMRINSLKDSFQASQESAIVNVQTALKSSDTRIDDLEQSLKAEKKRTTNLAIDLANHKYEAETKNRHLTGELASQRNTHDLTKSDLQKAKNELEEASRRAADLQNDFRAVKQQNDGLQAELDLAKQQPANLEVRLKAVEQQNASLETDLRSATQRASTAEDELKAFRSRFKQITDDMTALASSSEQQSTVTKTAPSLTPPPVARPSVTRQSFAPLPVAPPSFALPQHQQGTMEERKGGPQKHDTRVQTQSLDSNERNSTGDKEPDLLHCQRILDIIMSEAKTRINLYFFSPKNADTRALLTRWHVKLGPVNLSIMRAKILRGAYTSSASFKADFDVMVADCKRLNPFDSLVCKAADELVKVFERAWSFHGISSHESRDHINQDQESCSHKRKASTEGPVSSESEAKAKKTRQDPPLKDNAVEPANSATEEGIGPASTQPGQLPDIPQAPAVVDASVWQGKLTVGPSIDEYVALDVTAKPVSVAKSASTQNDWKNLIPHELRLTAHAKRSTVYSELFSLNCCLHDDMITLRVQPASGTDTSAFRRLSRYLVSKERFATISHKSYDQVKKIYLIPTLPKNDHPSNIRSLGHKVLPQARGEDVMFMVIVYCVNLQDQELVRQTWNDIIKAVHSPDMGDLEIIRDRLMEHPLPIYQPTMAVFSTKRYFISMFKNIPLTDVIVEPKPLGKCHYNFLTLSYPELDHLDSSSIDGVQLPEFVFILGRVVSLEGMAHELLVVDIENNDRPLWMIPGRRTYDYRLGRTIGLLASKFPQSLKEWEETITDKLREVQLTKQLKDTGLRIERY